MKAGRQLIPRLRAQRLAVLSFTSSAPGGDCAPQLMLPWAWHWPQMWLPRRLSLAARAVPVAPQLLACLGSSSALRSLNGSSKWSCERPGASASEACGRRWHGRRCL